MANLLQMVGSILVSGLLTGIVLVVVWGLIFIVMLKARNTFYHFRPKNLKQTILT